MKQRLLIPFSIAVFLSASLVFLVQPLFAKLLLPRYGGAPAVWNTCTVFFQAILLIGYCYTWLSTRWLTPKRQVIVHCLLLLTTIAFLPVDLPDSERFANWNPVFGLIAALMLALGGPYFAVSTTTPLIQHWFSGVGHERSHDPYFLYAISNAGSFVGLLAYPFAMELLIDLPGQKLTWSIGYGCLIVLTIFCGWLRFRSISTNESLPNETGATTDSSAAADAQANRPLTFQRRARWVVQAFVPSALMLAVTTRITTDVAAVPLFWVIPLAIYLASYIHAFARRRLISTSRLSSLMLPTLCIIAWSVQLNAGNLFRAGIDIWMFVLSALLFHGQLADDRPSTTHLTEYYFWLAAGGCLGGTLIGLIAPVLFTGAWEFAITLTIAASVTTFNDQSRSTTRAIITAVLLLAYAGTGILARFADVGQAAAGSTTMMVGYLGTAIFFWQKQAKAFAIAFGLIVIPMAVIPREASVMQARSFFGVIEVRVTEETTIHGPAVIHRLVHGTTNHGQQITNIRHLTCSPLAYYGASGPMGNAFSQLGRDKPRQVGVVGLGSGAIHCYSKPEDNFEYFEIDPIIRDIAMDPNYFTYLQCGGGKSTIHVGDGRILLANEPDGKYDILLIDAFGSDSVPIHLLTAEALDIFVKKLKPEGVLLFHISNRFLDLEPVLGKYAKVRNLRSITRNHTQLSPQEMGNGQVPSQVVAISHSPKPLDQLRVLNPLLKPRIGWRKTLTNSKLWTDQHSSILEHSQILEHVKFSLNRLLGNAN